MKNSKGFIGVIALWVIALAALGASLYSISHKPQPVLTVGNYNPTGGGTYRLNSSIGSSDTSITLSSFKEPVSNIPYTMSYLNSSIEYATLEPQSSQKEFISFSGITQNSDGTATLTGVIRGLSFSYPFTASTTLQQAHSGQSILILSNPPQLYTQQTILSNQVSTSSVSTIISSTTPWRYDLVPISHAQGTYVSTTSELASVAYVNAVALTSAPNAATGVKGVVQIATAAQAAAGTGSGSTGALLVTPSSIFSSTQSAATLVPVTNGSGKLSQSFLDLSQVWNFTGAVNASSTANFIASSTQFILNVGQINATSTPKVNGVALVTPTTVPHYSLIGQADVTAVTGYATSSIISVPAGVMSASSTIEVKGTVSCTGGTTEFIKIVNANGAPFVTGPNLASNCGTTNVAQAFTVDIFPNNSVSAQITNMYGMIVQTSGTIGDTSDGGGEGTSSFDLSQAFSVSIVVNSNGNGVTLKNYSIIVNP